MNYLIVNVYIFYIYLIFLNPVQIWER